LRLKKHGIFAFLRSKDFFFIASQPPYHPQRLQFLANSSKEMDNLGHFFVN